MSLFVAGAALGEVQVSLFVAGAALGDFFNDRHRKDLVPKPFGAE